MKKNIHNTIIYLLFCLFLFQGKSCTTKISNNQTKLICIDKDKSYKTAHLFIQDFAKSIQYITLETNNNCLIGKESKIESIRATEKDIFIIEWNTIYRFSRKDGKFLNQIGKMGAGPKEFACKRSVFINEKKQEIFLHDIMKYKILVYSFDGIFKKEIDILPVLSQLELIDENTFAAILNSPHTDIPGFGLYSLSDGKIIKKLSGNYKSRSTKYHFVPKYTTPRINKNEIFFNSYITDTIFSVNKNECTPRYALLSSKRDKESCSPPFLLCETDTFAHIAVHDGSNKLYEYFIINKSTDTITKGYVVNREYSGPIFPFNTGLDNEIAALHYAHALKGRDEAGTLFGKLKEITKNLDEEDNPVVVIANF